MRKLAWVTVGLTYFLMVWGNIVSSTGAGLACPDWPLCHGTFLPAISVPVALEWGHRLIAATTTFFIFTLLFQVFKNAKPESRLRRSGKSLLTLLGVQILLGGTTVLLGLSIAVSTVHLIVATLVFSGLIATACVVTWDQTVVVETSPKLQRLITAGLAGLLVQFALGAVVRHAHAGLACPNFPYCLNGLLPDPLTLETAVSFFHRWWGILMMGVFAHLGVASAKTPLARPARMALRLSVAQVVLGIGTVLSGLSTHARAVHAAVGYALWGSLFYLAVRSGKVRWLWE